MTKALEIGLNQTESLPIAEENSAADPELKLSSAQISNLNTAKKVAFPSTSPPLSSGSETEERRERAPGPCSEAFILLQQKWSSTSCLNSSTAPCERPVRKL